MVASDTLAGVIDDTRSVFASTDEPISQAQQVAGIVGDALSTSGWLEEEIEPEGSYTRKILYVDDDYGYPESGFRVTASITEVGHETGRGSPVHDHGSAWVVYGVYRGTSDQSRYRWAFEDPVTPSLEEETTFNQEKGDVTFLLPGLMHRIHPVNAEESCWVFRLESQNTDTLTYYTYNEEENAATVSPPAA